MRLLNLLKILLKIFKETKFIFKKPKKVKLLIYDQGKETNKLLKKYFKEISNSVLYVRYEELNLHVLKNLFFKLKFFNRQSLFQNYIIEYCKISNAKIIISSTLFDQKLFNIRKNLKKKIKLILLQKFPVKEDYFKLFKKKKIVDYFFVSDDRSIKILKKFFISKFIKIGLFTNNENKKTNLKKNKKILLISGFRPNFIKINPVTEWEKNIIHEKKIISIMDRIFDKKDIFKILLKPLVNTDEYINFMGCKKKILIFNNYISYKIIDKFDLVITLNNGTMGYEALSRKIKHIQIPKKEFKLNSYFYVFNNKLNYFNLKNFISYYSKISKKNFFEKIKKSKVEVPIYNYKNTIIKNYIKKLSFES